MNYEPKSLIFISQRLFQKQLNFQIVNLTLLYTVVFLILFIPQGCKKIEDPNPQSGAVNGDIVRDFDISTLSETNREMLLISNAIHNLMKNEEFRNVVKQSVLKKQNGDNEVLIASLLEVSINGDNIESLINQSLGNTISCEEALRKFPNLTIGVPTLPENSFSPKTWDTHIEIPVVATRLIKNNHVPIVKDDGYVEINPNYVPGFPIVIIKQNERITSSLTEGYSYFDDKPVLFTSKYNVNYKLRHQEYINSRSSRYEVMSNVHQRLKDAYYAYQSFPTGWQRDYVYYGITPTNTNGSFNNTCQEKIFNINFSPNPLGALNRMSDQDGTYSDGINRHPFWTDNDAELCIRVHNYRRGSGTFQTPTFPTSVAFSDLFNLNYVIILVPGYAFGLQYGNNNALLYLVTSVTAKDFRFPIPIDVSSWNLNLFAATWDIEVVEQDAPGTLTKTLSTQHQYAANVGGTTKFGLNWGVSGTKTLTSTEQYFYSLGDDNLGIKTYEYDRNVVQYAPPSGTPIGNVLFRTPIAVLNDVNSSLFRIQIRPD